MGAAYRFDPQRIGPERWATYAWMTLKHTRRRGADQSGVIRSRSPRATTVTLGDTEPVSREPGPDAGIQERQAVAAIVHALEQLPPSLRNPLLESMQGSPAHVIAEDFGFSESTARRRIQEARDYVGDKLARHGDDGGPYETVTDPVLERSQRLFEKTFAPSLGPEPGRGRDI